MESRPTSPLDGTISKLPWKLDSLLRRRGCILPKGLGDEIPLIQRDLEKIMSILSNLQDDSAMMVRCWRKEVRELSYDMEDFLDQDEDEHAATRSVPLPRRKITQRRNSKTTLPWLREKLRRRLWMANKIREFSVRAHEALQRHSLYNLDAIAASPMAVTRCTDASSTSWYSTPYGAENDYVGIKAAMEKLDELLMHDHGHQKLTVVSIVGFGGIGKTTLANELYKRLGFQFECRAFVRTSRKPDMRRILISMLSQVCPHRLPDSWTVHCLISTIRTHLQDKRYLIFIEDLWATSTWEILKLALPDGNCCSRILITTEIEDLALLSCDYDPKYVFKMKPLGEDDSRQLFFSSVFGPQHECPPELKEISYDIITKCGGLPLAIVTVASIFAGQLGVKEQLEYLNKSLGYSLITNPALEGMKQVLDLSYNNLSQNLKACILYTSLYEEDIVIWRDDLVNQWIAEGFISATCGQDVQEISRGYFDELVGRKMIQPVYVNDNGEVLSCVVHQMLLNLIITSRSIQENFVTMVQHSQATTTLADRIRRLSLQYGNAGDAMPPTNMRLSQVRTLVYFGDFRCMPPIVEFRLLQVLILHFWGDKDSVSLDLTKIGELFRLRYLKVSSNVTLELCTRMQGLQSLETLTIDARVRMVPSDIVHLRGLLHLNLPEKTNLPDGIGHMTSLRTLGCFDLSTNTVENIESLGMLTNLRDLQLTCSTIQPEILNDRIQFVVNSILGRLKNINSLTLVPSVSPYASPNSMTIYGGFSSLSYPTNTFQTIQSLKVSSRIYVFFCLPNWMGRLCKLSILKIGVRKIDCHGIDVLGGLPALSVLSLYVQTKPAARIVIGKTGFTVIKYFKFKCYDPYLKFEEGAMPNLHKLKLVFNASNSDQQSTMPAGIRFLSDLKEVSAKIGGAGPDESHRTAVALAFKDAISAHAKCQRVNIQCIKQVIGGMEDQTSITPEEEYGTLKQNKILDGKDSDEHDKFMQDSRQVSKDADYRSTLSDLHILLLLRSKLDNQQDDITRSIPTIDVYSYDPWKLEKIGAMHGGLFLFFRPHPLQQARSVVPIKTPSGYWEVSGLPGHIYSAERFPIGVTRTMEFYRSHHVTSGTKSQWKITEFMALQNASAGAEMMPRSEMSLCRLHTEFATNPADEISEDNPSSSAKSENGQDTVLESMRHIKELVGQLEGQVIDAGLHDLCKDLASQIYSLTEPTIGLITASQLDGGGRKWSSADAELASPLSARPTSSVTDGPLKNTKSRKVTATRRHLVRVSSADDGHSWRKYGQKDILGAKCPRNYYRCNSQGCLAKKQVQRSDEDLTLFEVTYHGEHACHDKAVAGQVALSLSSGLTEETEDNPLARNENHACHDKAVAEQAALSLSSGLTEETEDNRGGEEVVDLTREEMRETRSHKHLRGSLA